MSPRLSKLCLIVFITIAILSKRDFSTFTESVLEKKERQQYEHLRFRGFCYSPFRSLGPLESEQASESQVREDLSILKQLNATHIRTYGVGLNQVIIPKIAHELGISCATGVWIGNDDAANLYEIDVALSVANASSMFIVGNEVLFNGDLTDTELVDYIYFVKSRTSIPVTTAEPWYIWLEHPTLVNACDMLLIHVHPFWESSIFIDEPLAPELLANYTISIFNQIQEEFPIKEIIITETGWPSAGRWDCSEETQRQYFEALFPLIHEYNIKSYAFEAFDEIWKSELWHGNQSFDIGPHWGIFNLNRTEKLAVEVFREWFNVIKVTTCSTNIITLSYQNYSTSKEIPLISSTKSRVFSSNGFEMTWGISISIFLLYKRKKLKFNSYLKKKVRE